MFFKIGNEAFINVKQGITKLSNKTKHDRATHKLHAIIFVKFYDLSTINICTRI